MSNLIGVGDYVTPIDDNWRNLNPLHIALYGEFARGPKMGAVLKVADAKNIYDHPYLNFEEFGAYWYQAGAFRKVIPEGLAVWLSEVNMNPEVKESEPA